MRFSPAWKFLAAVSVATALAVCAILLLGRWSFISYFSSLEKLAQDRLIANLALRHEREGGWDFVVGDRRVWRKMLLRSLPEAGPGRQPRPRYHRLLAGRVALFDADKQLLAGRIMRRGGIPGEMEYLPIESGGKTVAYLGVKPRSTRGFAGWREAGFFKHLGRAMLIFGAPILLAVLLPLWFLSRRRPSPGDTALTAADVVVDEGRCAIRIRGRALDTTIVEFKLFQLLFSRPGHIFSRRSLMDNIYTDHRVVSDRTIDSHVKKLRGKIKTALAEREELIHSVYGAGYKYEYRRRG